MPAKRKTPAKKQPAPRKKVVARKKANKPVKETRRLWLTYPSKMISRPLIWELGEKFNLVTNVRQASVAKDIAIVSVQLEGTRDEIKKAVAWVEKRGIAVEPVEIGAIAG